MASRCCVFVDGENLRHSITDLFEDEFDQSDYLPKEAKWEAFFDSLATRPEIGCGRLRTYWYVIQHLDFTPYSLPRLDRGSAEQERFVKLMRRDRHLAHRIDHVSSDPDDLASELGKIREELQLAQARMQQRFAGWTKVQDAIAQRHVAVEFRRAGSIRYNLFTRRLGSEKAVDVKLATDLLMLRDIYDVAIIVSGDQDYVPAVQVVKDAGKRVVNVSFEARNGRLLPGGAWRLNKETDLSLRIPYDEFRHQMNLERVLDAQPPRRPDSGGPSPA